MREPLFLAETPFPPSCRIGLHPCHPLRMKVRHTLLAVTCCTVPFCLPAQSPTAPAAAPAKQAPAAAVSSLAPEDLAGFDDYPQALQSLVRRALGLTTKNLRYQFGSSDTGAGGLDCSGAIYRVLQDEGFKDTPRQSDEICRWLLRHSVLYRTEFPETLSAPAFSALQPGDLVFWSGTYEPTSARELPITHVMLYLGKRKSDGKAILFGASDGRTYDGQRRSGVSVFDFHIPARGDKSAIFGYGSVPSVKPLR